MTVLRSSHGDGTEAEERSVSEEKSQRGNERAGQHSPEGTIASAERASHEVQREPGQARTVTGLQWFFAYTSVIASVLLFALDNTIVADIQPSIIASLGDMEKLPWIGIAFPLGSILILPIGKAYGHFPIKWLFLANVVLFEAGSALCGAAPTMDAMILGRVLSGIGGAGVYSGGLTYISVTTTPLERPLYMSGVAGVWGVGSVIGPVIGGAFAASSATWRWAFYINLVVAALMAPAFLFCLPPIDPAPHAGAAQRLATQDWLGIALFAAGSACFTMAITFGGVVYAFGSGAHIALWAATGVLLLAFVLATAFPPWVAAAHKLYPAHFLRRLELNILQYELFLASGAMMVTVYYTPLLFQFTRGDGPLEAGVRILPLICLIVVFAILNGALMPKFGYHMPWYVFGNAMMLIGSALMSTITSQTPPARIYGYTALLGAGIGSFLTAGFAVVQALVPVADVNNAVGYMSIGQAFGAITLLAIAGALFQNTAAARLAPLLPGAAPADLAGLAAGTSSALFRTLPAGEGRARVVEVVTEAMRGGFLVLVAASALGLVLSLFLSRKKLYLQA